LPYKSKAEREREQWMTRSEAIALIAKLDGCDRRSASKQFADLLGDGVLRFKWEDLPKPIRPVIGVAAPDSMDWRQVRFRRDKVFDQWWTRQWRRPLFHRDDILRPWKESSVASAVSENGQATDEPTKKDAVRGDAVTDEKPNERQKAASKKRIRVLEAMKQLINDKPAAAGFSNEVMSDRLAERMGEKVSPKIVATVRKFLRTS
jgi:hypothetical protein